MKIQKFFRQYSRTLLMVFMALLLVTFLIPTTIQGCGERQRMRTLRWGEAYGATISDRERDQAYTELSWLSRMGLPPPGRSTDRDAALYYCLLNLEARHLGLRVGRGEAVNFLQQIGLPDEVLQNVAQRARMSYEEIYDMVGRWMAVARLMELQASALVDSLPRAELQYRDKMQEAGVQLSCLDARALLDGVPEPTEEELQAFFDEAKDRSTAHTPERLEFGYRLPDRVEVEYLTINPEVLKPKLSARELNQYFEDHRQRYTKPDPTAGRPADGSPPPQIPMTFDEARERVREDLRRQKAVEEAQRLVNEMYNDARQPWLAGKVGPAGFAVPPAGEFIAFPALRDRYAAQAEIEYHKTELLDRKGLQALPGFGQAGLGGGQGQPRLSAADLALRVEGLLEKAPDDRQPVLALMEPAPVVQTQQSDAQTRQARPYQAFLFRVVQVAPNAPPVSLDEVRTQLVKDWKLMKAYELAGGYAERLAARAREVGLAAAVAEATELREMLTAAEQAATPPGGSALSAPPYMKNLGPFTPERFTRQSTYVKQVGMVGSNVPAALFALAEPAEPTTAPSESAPVAASAPSTTSAPAAGYRVAVVPQADRFRWLVGEFDGLKPLYEESFQAQLAQDTASGATAELRRFRDAWVNPGNVQQRTGFRPSIEATPRPGDSAP